MLIIVNYALYQIFTYKLMTPPPLKPNPTLSRVNIFRSADKTKTILNIYLSMELLSGTLPVNSKLLSGTLPANNKLLSGTLPANNKL